jgi:hypothetical protein
VSTRGKASTRMHDWLHQLPGMPAHDQAARLNSNQASGRLRNRSLPNRSLPNRPLPNRAGHYRRPPRVLAGWQARVGRLFGQEPR